jgi:hypothetical protein
VGIPQWKARNQSIIQSVATKKGGHMPPFFYFLECIHRVYVFCANTHCGVTSSFIAYWKKADAEAKRSEEKQFDEYSVMPQINLYLTVIKEKLIFIYREHQAEYHAK